MKILLKVNWILITILSIATGIFKILQQPEDIRLFETIGINAFGTTIIGVIQLAGGIMLVVSKTRVTGAWVMILTFILASIAVFANQMYVFGVVSLLFIVMTYLVIYKTELN